MANTTSANLKLTVQATGENSGTWGQITNTNLLILEQAIGGYDAVALNATTGATLTFSNGALSNGKNKVIKLTGTITANVNVVIPDSIEKTYIIENATSGAFTVTVKTSSGTGVTWAATDKGKKMVYSDGTNILEGISSIDTLKVSTLTSTGIDDNATSTAITIDSSEQVGIGTASPASILDVRNSDSLTDIRIENEGTGGAKLRLLSGGTSAQSSIDFGDDDDSNIGSISYVHNGDYMRFVTNAAERMRILSTGGITFNGDTATANALNDYEEGTWSATSGGSSIGSGTYRKIGNFVYADLVISSNSLSITGFGGLPFSMSGANGYSGGFWGRIRFSDVLDANGVPCRIGLSAGNVNFYDNNVSGTDAPFTVTTQASGTVRLGLTLIGFTT